MWQGRAMPRAPQVTGPELVRALKRAGWYEHDQEGSHVQLKHATHSGKITVPVHAGQIIVPKTLANVLRQASLTADDLRALL